MDHPSGVGSGGAPFSPDSYKKAIYCPAPTHFSVEVLPPIKQGGSYVHGMRIHPIRRDNHSMSSRMSDSAYEVWRKWEDCLIFQDLLESEYKRLSHDKKKRLLAGKGIRKNDVYVNSDRAASWDSLPPGPDPNSVAQDIHDLVPKLTKKASLFRPSQSTIDQRHHEFEAFVKGLLQEDVPTLVQELRSTREIADFFGIWRQDHDNAVKTRKRAMSTSSSSSPRNSTASSVISSYFASSASSISGSSEHTVREKGKATMRQRADTISIAPSIASSRSSDSSHSSSSSGGSSIISSVSSGGSPSRPLRSAPAHIRSHYSADADDERYERRLSSSSLSSDSSFNTTQNSPQSRSSSIVIAGEHPVDFSHNPNQRRPSASDSLQQHIMIPIEEEDVCAPPKLDSPPVSARSGRNSRSNRSVQVYGGSPTSANGDDGNDSASFDSWRSSMSRLSWMTTASTDTMGLTQHLADLGLQPVPDDIGSHRQSMESMSSILTACPPDSPTASTIRQSRESISSFRIRDSIVAPSISSFMTHESIAAPSMNRRQRPISVPESIMGDQEGWAEEYLSEGEDGDSLIDVYFDDLLSIVSGPTNKNRTSIVSRGSSASVSPSQPTTPPRPQRLHISTDRPSSEASSNFSYNTPSSPISVQSGHSGFSTSTFTSVSTSTSTSTNSGNNITIKVGFESHIVLLRVPRAISFDEMRVRIYDKMVGQEDAVLSRTFGLVYDGCNVIRSDEEWYRLLQLAPPKIMLSVYEPAT